MLCSIAAKLHHVKTDRQRDRRTDGQTGRQTDTHTHTDTHTDTHAQIYASGKVLLNETSRAVWTDRIHAFYIPAATRG